MKEIKEKIKKILKKKEKKIKKLKEEKNILKEKNLRILAEFENFQKRKEKEKKDIFKSNIINIIKNILPILDDIKRLIKEEKITKDKGIYLIYKNFKKILKSYGLKKIKVKIGDNFDLNLHYAISKKKNKKMQNKILEILEDGYYLEDKIIRCTKVIVGF
ncbi:MAG: nucleotide exchange factor GrpE [Candidatus Shikimatogenerans sp. JK-2022]|nr:nucleotide exchange factor GrpE [Candidatus Shikimatogenerans bostrichidophilus]